MKNGSKILSKGRAVAALAAGLVIAIVAAMLPFGAKCAEIRKSVFRLHIIAASDSSRDQALKIKVRDGLLSLTDEIFSGARTAAEAEEAARNNIAALREKAAETLRENGCSDSVSLTVGTAWFNTREYDDFTLPAGEYEALRVVIGEGKGKNWWCVMFPAVCLPAASAEIDDALDEDSSEIVHGKTIYKPAFGIVELYERIRKLFTD